MKKMTDGFTLERPRVIYTKPIPQNEVHNLEDFINKTLLPYGSFSKIRFSIGNINGNPLSLRLDGQLYGDGGHHFEVDFSSATFGESESKTTFTYNGGTKTVLNSITVATTDVGGIPSLKATIYGIR